MFIKYLSEEEKEIYFKCYMESKGYKRELWMQSNIVFEVWRERKRVRVIAYKTVGRKQSCIYEEYHKSTWKFDAIAGHKLDAVAV